jgi:enoyl-CoA hydratase/carnithine racemase
MSYRYLSVDRRAGVVTCTLRNPPMNYMNHGMVLELDQLTREVEAEPADRVLLLTGGLDGIFITHYDVSELQILAGRSQERDLATSEAAGLIHTVFNRLERMPKITVAALNGTAMGGGCELSLACDFRVMADGPFRYGLPETSLGIIPGAGGTQRMTRLLGVARALDLILHAHILTPAEAYAGGLVHRLYPAAEFHARAAEFAADLAERAPLALAAAKEAIRGGAELKLDQGLALERRAFARTMRSADARNAMGAYTRGESYAFKGE